MYHDLSILFLAEQITALLESPYKPILFILPFIPWAWLISSKLEKDARYFHFNAVMWNSVFLGTGAAALIAGTKTQHWIPLDPARMGIVEQIAARSAPELLVACCPYGKPGDMVVFTWVGQSLLLGGICNRRDSRTLTSVTVNQRDGEWCWVLEWGQDQ